MGRVGPGHMLFGRMRPAQKPPSLAITLRFMRVVKLLSVLAALLVAGAIAYEAYERYPDKFQEYVVQTLQDTYLTDKAAFRRRLYGIKED